MLGDNRLGLRREGGEGNGLMRTNNEGEENRLGLAKGKVCVGGGDRLGLTTDGGGKVCTLLRRVQ